MTGYYFGPYFFDSVREVLVSDGVEHSLRHQTACLLAYFLEHEGQEVTKKALCMEVWREAHVSQQAIFQSINQLRRALDEDKEHPRFLKTLPRVGYQWICPLRKKVAAPREDEDGFAHVTRSEPTEVGFGPPTHEENVAPDYAEVQLGLQIGTPSKQSAVSKIRSAAKLLAILSLILIVGWWQWFGGETEQPAQTVAGEVNALRLVLLPFVNETEDARLGWLELGLPEMVAQHLRGQELRVVPITRVVRALGDGVEARQLWRDPNQQAKLHRLLGADWLVFGRLTKDEQGFRMVFEGQHEDGLAVEGDLVDRKPIEASLLVANRIADLLFGAEMAAQYRPGKQAGVGEEELVRGVQLLFENKPTQSIDWFKRSLKANPELLWARYYLAESYFDLGLYHEAMAHIEPLINDLVASDRMLLQSNVWALRGEIDILRENWQQAEADYRLAIAFASDAGDPEATAELQAKLASILVGKGRTEEAEDLFSQATTSLREIGDLLGLYHLHMDRVDAASDQERWPEAKASLDEVMLLAETIADSTLIGDGLIVRATMLRILKEGDPKRVLASAQKVYEQGSDYGGAALVHLLLGEWALEDGAMSEARVYGDQALELSSDHPEMDEVPFIYFFAARLAAIDDLAEEAERLGRQALTATRNHGHVLDLDTLFQLASYFRQRNEYDRGQPFLEALIESHQQEPIPKVVPLVARYWLQAGEVARASELLRDALDRWPGDLGEEGQVLARELNIDKGMP